jgi:hypothetical protein
MVLGKSDEFDHFCKQNMRMLSGLLMIKGEDIMVSAGGIRSGETHGPIPSEGLKVAQEDYIGSSVLVIETIIYEKLDEIQRKFQDRFDALEQELRRRDELISVLQNRFHDLEGSESGSRKKLRNNAAHSIGKKNNHLEDTRGTEGDIHVDEDMDDNDEDEGEDYRRGPAQMQSSYLFSRGDSIDTVIRAQEFDDEVFERSEIEYEEAREVLLESGRRLPYSPPRQDDGRRTPNRRNRGESSGGGRTDRTN